METIIIFLFLFLCGVLDWKDRQIPLWLCGLGSVVIILSEIVTKEFALDKILGGGLIGLFLLAAGKLTKGQIGSGDGIVFFIIGMALGGRKSFLLLIESLWIAFLFCLIALFIGKIKMKERIPFLPFVFVAYLLELVI